MKTYKITYYLKPEADNINITISAKSYEYACILAKSYRAEGFSCEEITENNGLTADKRFAF